MLFKFFKSEGDFMKHVFIMTAMLLSFSAYTSLANACQYLAADDVLVGTCQVENSTAVVEFARLGHMGPNALYSTVYKDYEACTPEVVQDTVSADNQPSQWMDVSNVLKQNNASSLVLSQKENREFQQRVNLKIDKMSSQGHYEYADFAIDGWFSSLKKTYGISYDLKNCQLNYDLFNPAN